MPIDYKKLYQNHNIILTNSNPEEIVEDGTLESVNYLKNYFIQRNRYKPPVDFSDLKNFARFGSAKKYYADAFDRIAETYPYDGSLKERVEWELSSSFFDMYVFDEVYPRTNGYVLFSAEGWGTKVVSSDHYGAPATSSHEYVFTKGGPHTSTRSKEKDIQDASGDYKSGYANIWEPEKNRECNLKIGGIDGNTVEFWMKKAAFATTKTGREVVFDATTSDFISSSANYGRLTIEMTGTTSGSPFMVSYMSGTSGFNNQVIGSSITTSSVADDTWHHYAFTFKNSGNAVEVNFYFDGTCEQTTTLGSSIGYVSGNINATIGSLITAPSGTQAPTKGWGKLSGSLDEFRFWKDQRSSPEIFRYRIEPVGGGTNTDDANTALGVYYKFNEGVTSTTSIDQTVLDYSGRISNGTFVGYGSSSRSTNSAMVESGLVTTEFKDPILYTTHPTVLSTIEEKRSEGELHDISNNSAIYHSLPAWITEDDEDKQYSPLKNLTQIVGSYFDSLAEQINSIPKFKQKVYLSSSHKPAPFNDRLLHSIGFEYFPELFSDASELEYFKSRNDREMFEKKLYDVKNRIYRNIYNNIVYINKTKGTEKSFRNLLHCFGVGDEIYRLNTYGNRVTYTLKDNYRSIAEYKKYVNFALTGTSEATVFAHSSSTNPDSKAIISGTYGVSDYLGFTMETEVHFPIRHSLADSNTVAETDTGPSRQFRTYFPFNSASLFGVHEVNHDATGNVLNWASDNYANFKVLAVKSSDYSKRCKFVLTGSDESVFGPLGLSSSYIDNVFDDTRWTFSVALKPNSNANLPDGSSGSINLDGYTVEFYGIEKIADYTKNEFYKTASITADAGSKFLNYPKAAYIGAHRTNFSGTLLTKTDGNISSTRVWLNHIPTGTIKQHHQDVKNYGVEHPYRSAHLYPTAVSGTKYPEIDTLVLNWTFDTVTGSDGSGEFIGADYSSGSARKVAQYGPLGEILGKQYLARGYNFPANSTLPINKKYVSSAKKQLPEMINSSDMVNILTDDDEFFNKVDLLRPTNYYMSVEKSMYQTISDEMVKMFSTIKDFNNLVGEPVNKYRHDYKDMAKLRQLFYERVGNTPDLDKYVDFYKWIDITLDTLLGYLIPFSADMSDRYGSNVRTMVENTILHRNKYKWQYPTLEDKTQDIEGNILGINELLYDWKHGHAGFLDTAWSSNSLLFVSGSGNALTVPDTTDLSFGDGTDDVAFSVGFWMKWAATPSGDEHFFNKGDGSSAQEYDVYFKKSSNRIVVQLQDGTMAKKEWAEFAFDPATYVGNWTHVVITYDGAGGTSARNGIKLYVNGAAVSAATTNGINYVAMENTSELFRIASAQQGSATSTGYTFNGHMDEFVVYKSLELSAAQVLTLYNSGCPRNAMALDTIASLVAYWRMGEYDTISAGGIQDSSGNGHHATPRKSSGSDLSIAENTAASCSTSSVLELGQIEKNCLWWNERAEKSNPAITSLNNNVDSDKQTIQDSIVNETNASAPTLGSRDSSTGAISTYQGSTYVTRRLAKPLRLKVDESPTIKGGANEAPNKQTDLLLSAFIKHNTPTGSVGSHIKIPSTSVESFKNCNDDLALNNGKRKQTFNSTAVNPNFGALESSYLNAKGDMYTPFDIYSASAGPGGYYDIVSSSFKANVDITNLHEDSYGPLYGRPMQTPFTEKFVGGKVHRHIYSNLRPNNSSPDGALSRPEGWKIKFSASSLYLFGGGCNDNMTPNPHIEKGAQHRDEFAKRPVNIRNIKMFTGSTTPIPGRPDQVLNATNIGNYTSNYELLMTTGRSINNRTLAETAEGAFLQTNASTWVSGVVDFTIPRRDITGSTKSIIVNRFSAPGDPATMGEGMLDHAAAEYSVYNALPWRNLSVRNPLNEWYTDHTKQFGFFSDNQTVAAYGPSLEAYPGGNSSVSSANYSGTGSFHKINRNGRRKLGLVEYEYENTKILYFNGVEGSSGANEVNIGTAAQWDALIGNDTSGGSRLEFTLSAWINPSALNHTDGNNQPRILDFGESDVALFVDNSGKVYFYARWSGSYGIWYTTSLISTDTWTHVAVAYTARSTSNNPSIYINGEEVSLTESSTPAGTWSGIATEDCFIGNTDGNSRCWQGHMDEISIWNSHLSAAQVQEIYDGTEAFDPTFETRGPGDLSLHSAVSFLLAWWGGEGHIAGSTVLPSKYSLIPSVSLNGTLKNSNMVITNNDNTIPRLLGGKYLTTKYAYDNWFVQHPLPQTDLQYTWITASVANATSSAASYDYQQPDYANSSLASSDILFVDGGQWNPSLHGGVSGPTIDFAGINSIIYDPIVSSENLLSASSGDYRVLFGTGLAQSCVLNGLTLHRQGAYGWPSWKQIRGAQHPVMRYNYKNNIQSFTEVSVTEHEGFYGENKTMVSQTVPPITSKFAPLKYKITYNSDQLFDDEPPEKGMPDDPTQVTNMWSSYGNEKSYFTNVPDPTISGLMNLNDSSLVWSKAGQVGETLESADNKILAYDTLKKYLLWNTPTFISGDANPISKFHSLEIDETIFPREHYTYTSVVRQRSDNYDNTFWKDIRSERSKKITNSQGGIRVLATASIWSMDARVNALTSDVASAYTGSEGELQNSYSLYSSGNVTDIQAAATYARRIPELISSSAGSAKFQTFAGDTKWEAGEQSGYNPSYNTYKEYVEDVKRVGKDHGIIPEYRISEHMQYHVVDQAASGGFYAENPGWLTLTGAFVPNSSDSSFYTIYSNSDFLKHFEPIDSEFVKVAMPTRMKLKCSAITKFLPYDGFYPSERTVQLAQMFSQSFGPNTGLHGNQANWRTALKPFFAPGIMYNSIKSGIAVDHPLLVGGNNFNIYRNAVISGTFNRLPFEAIIDPEVYLAGTNYVYDGEPHPSASLNSSASINAASDDLYKMAANNFMSEVPRFFLGGSTGTKNSKYGPLTTFISKTTAEEGVMAGGHGIDLPGGIIKMGDEDEGSHIWFEENKTYTMRVVCSHSKIRNYETIVANDLRSHPAVSASFIYNEPTIMMYNRAIDWDDPTKYKDGNVISSQVLAAGERTASWQADGSYPLYGSSFGPPHVAGQYGGNSTSPNYQGGFEPYTPPYYNGYSHIELSYTPEYSGYKTISDVVSNVSASFYREPLRIFNTGSDCFVHGMQLSASLNWNQVVTENGKSAWVIQTKWECPVLDFTDSNISRPLFGSGSVSKGMWHQYGTLPNSPSKGIFMEIQAPSSSVAGTPVGNLAEKLGFDRRPKKRIGVVPSSGKKVSEAIVAVPFYEDHWGNRAFFRIDRKTIDWAISKTRPGHGGDKEYLDTNPDLTSDDAIYKPSSAIVEMVKSMSKYYVPPKFNFLINKEATPFAMVFFEFEHHFTQDDLVKMWQGILPSKGRVNAASGLQHAISEIDFGIDLMGDRMTLEDKDQSRPLENYKGWDLLNHKLGHETGDMGFPKNIQWMVFKVKQRATQNYYDLRADNKNSFVAPTSLDEYYSYNWPYDFFSLIELAKIQETVVMEPRKLVPTKMPSMKSILDLMPIGNMIPTAMYDGVSSTDPNTFRLPPDDMARRPKPISLSPIPPAGRDKSSEKSMMEAYREALQNYSPAQFVLLQSKAVISPKYVGLVPDDPAEDEDEKEFTKGTQKK